MFLFLLSLAHAGERTIPPSALPPSVSAAVTDRIPEAVIVGASLDGRVYEAQVTVGDRHLDLAFAIDGAWLEEEEVVAPDALPDAVKAALDARWRDWTVLRAERAITPSGTTFEVLLRQRARGVEVALSETGAIRRVERLHGDAVEEEEDD